MSKGLTASVQAAQQAAERLTLHESSTLDSALAALERRGARIETRSTKDHDGYLFVATAARWPKLLTALARVAIAEQHAFTSVGSDNHPPYYRQELVFERPGRHLFYGIPIDDVREELIAEVDEWEADYAGSPLVRFLKLIGADAGIVKWPAKIRGEGSESQEREYARIAHKLREQVENAAPFQVWQYARERMREFYEPINKNAKAWLAMTPRR